MLLALLLAISFSVFSGMFSLEASAASDSVMLTASQTRTLFGDTIPGQYFDGTDYQSCTFEYYDTCSFSSYSSGATNFGLNISSSTAFGTPAYTSYYGVVYKMQVNGNPVAGNPQYITAKIQPVLQLSGLYDLRFFCGFSAENKTSSSNITFSNSGNIDVTSNEGIRYYTDIDNSELTLQNARISSYYNYGSYKAVSCDMLTSGASIISSVIGLRLNSVDPFEFRMRYDSSCGVTQRGGVGSNAGAGTVEQQGIYFYLSTLYLSDTYSDSGSGDYGDSSSGSGGDSSSGSVQDIVNALDDLADRQEQNLSEDGPLSWIGTKISGLVSGIVDGIKGLFVPSSDALDAFRNSLDSKLHETFGAMYEADTLLHDAVHQINNTTGLESIQFPGIDLPIQDVNNGIDTTFSIDSRVVPLKPNYQDFSWNNDERFPNLYECVALAVDIVAVLLVVNMLRHKLEVILDGGKVRDDG